MKRSLFLFIIIATCNDDDADKMKDYKEVSFLGVNLFEKAKFFLIILQYIP